MTFRHSENIPLCFACLRVIVRKIKLFYLSMRMIAQNSQIELLKHGDQYFIKVSDGMQNTEIKAL